MGAVSALFSFLALRSRLARPFIRPLAFLPLAPPSHQLLCLSSLLFLLFHRHSEIFQGAVPTSAITWQSPPKRDGWANFSSP